MRSREISLTPKSGAITKSYAFVGPKRVIAEAGNAPAKGKCDSGGMSVHIKIRVWSVGDAQIELRVHYSDGAPDFVLTIEVKGGYHEQTVLA